MSKSIKVLPIGTPVTLDDGQTTGVITGIAIRHKASARYEVAWFRDGERRVSCFYEFELTVPAETKRQQVSAESVEGV